MPIRIPDNLPARRTLEDEGVAVMDSSRAARQDIRPLQIGLLNLMPNKERTETQFTRLIGSTPLQVDLTLVRITDHQSRNTSEDYLRSFYSTWEEVRERKFDGFIVTGAPIAQLPFEQVKYWSEMVEIMDWTQTNVHHTMFICWGAQAALHHFHRVRRRRREQLDGRHLAPDRSSVRSSTVRGRRALRHHRQPAGRPRPLGSRGVARSAGRTSIPASAARDRRGPPRARQRRSHGWTGRSI